MAGAVKRIGRFLGLVEDDIGYEPYEQPEAEPPVRTLPVRPAPEAGRAPAVRPPATAPAPRTELHSVPSPSRQFVTSKPHGFNDAAKIGTDFRGGHPIMLNLDDVDQPTRRRLIDFCAGLVMALEGTMTKVSANVLVLLPKGLDVTEAQRQTMADGHFFNQD